MEVKIYLDNNDLSKESFTFPYESEHPINTYFYLCNYYFSYRAQGASTTARSLWRHVFKLNFKAQLCLVTMLHLGPLQRYKREPANEQRPNFPKHRVLNFYINMYVYVSEVINKNKESIIRVERANSRDPRVNSSYSKLINPMARYSRFFLPSPSLSLMSTGSPARDYRFGRDVNSVYRSRSRLNDEHDNYVYIP